MTDERWIIIPNWDDFQSHGTTEWIKLYLELNSRDDWRQLTFGQRGMLVSIWVEYARSRGQLRLSDLANRVGKRDTRRTLDRLNHAGFVEISDERPPARARARRAKEKMREPAKAGSLSRPDKRPATPQQAATPAPPTPIDQARSFVRNAGWQDPHLARTLREDRPELTDHEIDDLVEFAATLRGEFEPA